MRRLHALGRAASRLAIVAGAAAAVPSFAAPAYTAENLGSFLFGSLNNEGEVLIGDFSGVFIYSGGTRTPVPIPVESVGFTHEAFNDRGHFTGVAGETAIIYAEGAWTELGSLHGGSTMGYAINNQGQVTGHETIPGEDGFTTFFYSDGVMQDIGSLSGGTTFGHDINESGHITGTSFVDGMPRAFIYADGAMRDLGIPFAGAAAINDSGQIAGVLLTPDALKQRAFLYSEGEVVDLGTLGAPESSAADLNNQGDVVGQVLFDTGTSRAFLYTKGVMHDLNDLLAEPFGFDLLLAHNINDRGQILAEGCTPAFDECAAFLLSPVVQQVSEPGVLALLGLSLPALLLTRCRTRRAKVYAA